jgi:hypothetical protein
MQDAIVPLVNSHSIMCIEETRARVDKKMIKKKKIHYENPYLIHLFNKLVFK